MPDQKFIQSLLNPVKFILYTPDTDSEYLSRHMDDFFYYETIKPWQQRKSYYQPWMNVDTISLQFQSELNPVKISLIDIDERVYHSVNMTMGAYVFDNPNLHIYEISLPLTSYDPGLYFLKIEAGPLTDGAYPVTLISEPLEIAAVHKHTVLLEYQHYEYYNDIAFETGFAPELRVRATLKYKNPTSKDTLFEDQPLNLKMLQSKPFRIWELKIGGATGIPDYLADALNRILGCSSILIDGKPYTKSEGAKMEESTQSNYPMRGWSVELRETENKVSNTYHGTAADITPPAIIHAVAIGPNTVRVTFSKSVIPTTVGWNIYIQDLFLTSSCTAVSGSGDTWDFTVFEAMAAGQTLFINYNDISGNTLDGTGTELPKTDFFPVDNGLAVVGLTAYLGWFNVNPFTALNTGVDAFVWPVSTSFPSGGAMTFNISSLPVGKYLAVKQPASEPAKANWFNTSFNNGTIPDSVFRLTTVNAGFRYYVTRNPTAFDTTQPLTIS
jgi:hypothetical protein